MNWAQVRAILWLRWRLTHNSFARAGALNVILALLFAGTMAVGSLAAGIGGVVLGYLVLAKAQPTVLLLVWDGLVCFFLLVWFSGLLVEIQRSESIDLSKLLHLPVTLPQVFVFNYLASHLTPAIVLLVPAMVGICLGLAFGAGVRLLALSLVVLAFIFMITAWTYCLRGWLAALMANKRRRRTILVWLTLTMVFLGQLPNLLLNSRVFRNNRSIATHRFSSNARGTGADAINNDFVLLHAAFPPGWVGYGAMSLALRQPWPSVGATAAALLLGGLGLRRAYLMSLRFYQGAEAGGRVPAAAKQKRRNGLGRLFGASIPVLAEDTSGLAIASFVSLWRSPELKMAFILPVVMGVALVSAHFTSFRRPPAYLSGFVAPGAAMAAAFAFAQVMANAFGLDRSGFRALVLLPVRRREVLLAKNLAFFPFAAAVALALLSLGQALVRMPWMDFLAGVFQIPAAFLLFCLPANFLTILVPYRLSQSTLQAKKPKPVVFFAVFLTMLILPLFMAPTLIPAGLGLLFAKEGWVPWLPINLVATVGLLASAGLLYWSVLPVQGRLLQSREQKILREVTEETE